jgi:hypothetical protein
MGPGAFAGRIERGRVGGHCGGAVGGGAGQRQRRVGAGAGALYGHLLAQADAGTDSGPRASAAVRGAVLDSGRHWAHGAHDGRRRAAVSHAERAGPARSGESADCAARAEARKSCANTIGFFEDDGLVPVTPETRAAVQAAARALGDAGFRVEPFRPRTLEQAAASCGGSSLCNAGRCFMRRDSRKRASTEPDLQGVSLGLPRKCAAAHGDRVAGRMGGVGPAAREDAGGDEQASGAALPGGQHSRIPSRRAEWMVEGQPLSILTLCGTRSGSMRWPRRRRWFLWKLSPEGLPIGVQIVARPFEDETALGVAAVVDAAFGYRSAADGVAGSSSDESGFARPISRAG